MTTYTDRLKEAMPENGTCNWKFNEDRNKELTDACISQIQQGNYVVSGGVLSGALNLNINIDETVVLIDGAEHTIAAGTLSLTGAVANPEERNWIWVNSSGVLQVSTVAPTGSFALIGLVDTSVTTVARQSDLRQVRIGGGTTPFMHVQDQKIAGTDGGDALLGNQTRTLNTVVINEITDASLSTNTITLPIGKYFVTASAPAYVVQRHRVFVVKDGTTEFIGENAYNRDTNNVLTRSSVSFKFTAAAISTLVVKQYIGLEHLANGLGISVGGADGRVEVYADVQIWKLDGN